MAEEGNLVVNPEGDGEPVRSMQDEFDVFMFSHFSSGSSGCTGASGGSS